MAGAYPCHPALPEHGSGEKESLARPSQAHADELGEEDAQAQVEAGCGGHLDCYAGDCLLSVQPSLERKWVAPQLTTRGACRANGFRVRFSSTTPEGRDPVTLDVEGRECKGDLPQGVGLSVFCVRSVRRKPRASQARSGVPEEVVQLQHTGIVLAAHAVRAEKRRMPLSTLIPAPMKAMRWRAVRIRRAASRMGALVPAERSAGGILEASVHTKRKVVSTRQNVYELFLIFT